MVSIAGLKVSSPRSHGFLFTGIAVSESPDTGVTEAGILSYLKQKYCCMRNFALVTTKVGKNLLSVYQFAKGWGNFISDRIIIWRLR